MTTQTGSARSRATYEGVRDAVREDLDRARQSHQSAAAISVHDAVYNAVADAWPPSSLVLDAITEGVKRAVAEHLERDGLTHLPQS